MISPAKTAADSRYWRSIKYSLFPPLGLATLAGYLDPDDEVDLQDEHVETLRLDDEPDLVVIEVYITSARRAYRYADHYRARGAYVCLGGLHPTSLPEEAAPARRQRVLRPGRGHLAGVPARTSAPAGPSRSTARRSGRSPACRRRAATSSSASATSCPTRSSSAAAARTSATSATRRRSSAAAGRSTCRRSTMPWPRSTASPAATSTSSTTTSSAARRSPRRSSTGCGGWAACGRRPGTVQAVLRPGLLEKAVESGPAQPVHRLRDAERGQPAGAGKTQNLAGARSGCGARRRSTTPPSAACTTSASWSTAAFVFGMDDDDPSVFARTVDWAVSRGIETATFHILTPYPGTRLERRLAAEGRITQPRLGPLRHAPRRLHAARGMTARRARGRLLARVPRLLPLEQHLRAPPSRTATCASTRATSPTRAAGRSSSRCGTWPIRSGQVHRFLPLLETILDRFGSGGGAMPGRLRPPAAAGSAAAALRPTAARPAAPLRRLA